MNTILCRYWFLSVFVSNLNFALISCFPFDEEGAAGGCDNEIESLIQPPSKMILRRIRTPLFYRHVFRLGRALKLDIKEYYSNSKSVLAVREERTCIHFLGLERRYFPKTQNTKKNFADFLLSDTHQILASLFWFTRHKENFSNIE